jgi:tetratricopeptide (TPR) repeat protein
MNAEESEDMRTLDELCNEILAEAPSPGTFLVVLEELINAGRLSKAIQEGIRALSLYPRDIRIRHLVAECCLESGWLSRAESEVETVTTLIDEVIPAYRLKAEIYLRSDRREEARKALATYLAHRPDDEEALSLMGDLGRAQEAPPLPPPAPLEEGKAIRDFGEDTMVVPDLSSLPEIATPTLAEVYFGQGQIQEAVDTYETFLSRNPRADQYRERLEELRAMLSHPSAAEKDSEADGARMKKERLIAALESWRMSLRPTPP